MGSGARDRRSAQEVEARRVLRWADAVAWREWFRRSPVALELYRWVRESGDYVWLLGADTYRERLVELVSRAVPRDCAAAGFGCARRVDRVCRAPQTCVLDPAGVPGTEGREGPVPGACGRFYGLGADVTVWIGFTGDDRHRAVLWREGEDRVRLWVDGVAVETAAVLDDAGYWVGGRFFVVAAEGPGDHPRQRYGPGALVSRIVSVLVYDAEWGSARMLVPAADELWTDPRVVLADGRLWVYGSGDDVGAGGGAPPRPVETS